MQSHRSLKNYCVLGKKLGKNLSNVSSLSFPLLAFLVVFFWGRF